MLEFSLSNRELNRMMTKDQFLKFEIRLSFLEFASGFSNSSQANSWTKIECFEVWALKEAYDAQTIISRVKIQDIKGLVLANDYIF